MMRALLLLALAGCGRLGFDGVATGDANGSGMTDALFDGASEASDATFVADAPSGACVEPAPSCAFDGALTCSCWGTPSGMNAIQSEVNSALVITPNANTAGTDAGCTRTGVPLGPEGLFVEVSSVTTGAQAITYLTLGTAPDTFAIRVQGTQVTTIGGTNMGTTGFNPVAMRWWRIRPTPTATVFERSPDGRTWTQFYSSGNLASPTYTVRIGAGTLGADPAPGTAAFAGINVCPP